MKIVNIDRDDLESLEQLKGYFNPDPSPESNVFFDLLDYGQHGDLAGWLREHGEEGMASQVDAIPSGLSDSKYYAALKQAVTGETVEDPSTLKPSFDRCFHYEGVDCNLEGNEAKVRVRVKVLMSVVENYRLEVGSGWGTRAQTVTPSHYAEGETAVIEFVLKKRPRQEMGNLVVLADGNEIYNKKAVSNRESLGFEVGGVSFKMIRVEGGTFTMGATSEQGSDAYSDEKPAHQVTLSSYYIGETQVTQALWRAVMESNPSHFRGGNLPVEQVSWDECQEFVRELNRLKGKNFRLPTEAEWEYAARGGNKSKGYKYSGSNEIGAVAWYEDNSDSKTHPVAAKSPNELGIYDMSGNVWEWCQDWYGGYSSDSQNNPQGPNSGAARVGRGGSWSDDAGSCRVSNRATAPPPSAASTSGFALPSPSNNHFLNLHSFCSFKLGA